MDSLKISPEVSQALEEFRLPDVLGFGKVLLPIMIQCHYRAGRWEDLALVPLRALCLGPTAKVLHYGQGIFEGLKAFCGPSGALLFRPKDHGERFCQSARIMAMPELDSQIWMDSVVGICQAAVQFIPQGPKQSLYLRPFMLATEDGLGIGPAKEFQFFVVASASESYFEGQSIGVHVERKRLRAFPGGTGMAKAMGNYGGAMGVALKAAQRGFQQVLWTSGGGAPNIEELSGMNFLAVVEGGLHTPELTDSILPGITRDSLLALAKSWGAPVVEGPMPLEEFLAQVRGGACTEAMGVGTAATVVPIGRFGDGGSVLEVSGGGTRPWGPELQQGLLDIQRGEAPDPYGWTYPI